MYLRPCVCVLRYNMYLRLCVLRYNMYLRPYDYYLYLRSLFIFCDAFMFEYSLHLRTCVTLTHTTHVAVTTTALRVS